MAAQKKTLGTKKSAPFKSPKTYSGKPFAGKLLEPIVIMHFPDITGDATKDQKLESIRVKVRADENKQWSERFEAFIEHYASCNSSGN